MNNNILDKIKINNLDVLTTKHGNVMHALKKSSENFKEFGEIYFSKVKL